MDAVMECVDPGVLQDCTNAVLNEQSCQPDAEPKDPPVGFIPRLSKPRTPPICRKIRQIQQDKWGQEEQLTLKPHRSRLEREKDAAQEAQEVAVSPRQAAIVHRLVSRAVAAVMPPKSRCNRLSMAFPPQKKPDNKQKDATARQWDRQREHQAAAVKRLVQRAVSNVLQRHAQLQENHAHAPVVCQREGTVEKHSRIWGNEQSLECLKPHRSKLEQEQAQWRRAAQQQQQQQ